MAVPTSGMHAVLSEVTRMAKHRSSPQRRRRARPSPEEQHAIDHEVDRHTPHTLFDRHTSQYHGTAPDDV